MGLWLSLAAMTALAVGLALLPLVRSPRAASSRHEHNLAVYRAQLDELRQERERGLIGAREAAAAELEIKRRMLADADDTVRRGPASTGAAKGLALAIAIGLPLFSLAVYWQLGSPAQPAAPFAQREAMRQQLVEGPAGAGAGVPSVESLVARLEERAEAEPADLETWLRLGRAYSLMERHEAAASAYRQVLALRDDLPSVHAALGEALIMAADGIVTEPARGAFVRALALDPVEPRARFYQGLALAQRGQQDEALAAWVDLLEDTPPDAPWLAALRVQIAELAAALGRDPDQLLPPERQVAGTGVGPPGADGPVELRARALRLETQLENDPKDWQGWIELARLWGGLGEAERARVALERGEAAYADAPFVQEQFRQAAMELGLAGAGPGQRGPSAEQVQAAEAMTPEEQEEMIRGMVDGLAARLEQTPDDLQGWRMLGRSYQVLGELDKAVTAYERLASLLPPDSPERAEVRAVIESLRAQN